MVPVNAEGYVDERQFTDILQSNSRHIALISIILAQNEVGTLQRIPALVKIAKTVVGPNVVFHTDATQAFGKYFVDPDMLNVDLLTASAHKYHGPRGVGILYARPGILDPSVLPITGGGQERGCRSGTENVPAIAAAATALEHMLGNQESWVERKAQVRALRNVIIQGVLGSIPGSKVNGDPVHGLYNLVSITLPGVNGVEVAKRLDLDGISIGSGSACSKGRPSEGLLAMGKSPEEIRGVIRISLSEFNSIRDCQEIINAIVRAWRRCKPQ
jgi:cysteine desulfurase